MKKIVNFSILVAFAFLFSLSGCMNENCILPDPPPYEVERDVTLRLEQSNASTRAGTDRPILDGEPVALRTGDLFLVSSTGVIVRRYNIVYGPNSGATATDLALYRINRGHLDTGVPMPSLPGNVAAIVIVGNHQGAGANALPAAGNVNTVIENRLVYNNILSQFHPYNPGVNMFGRTERSAFTPTGIINGVQQYTAVVHLAPTVARFELAQLTGLGSIVSFDVAGIFIDRHYRQAQIRGYIPEHGAPATATSNRREREANSALFQPGQPYFMFNTGSTTSGALFDLPAQGSTPVTGGGAMARRDGASIAWMCPVLGTQSELPVWGYQVFARYYWGLTTTSGNHTVPPRIVIRLGNVMVRNAEGNTVPFSGGVMVNGVLSHYLTVGYFNRNVNDVLTPVTGIRAGHVYHIENLVFDESNLSDSPNQRTMRTDVTIQLDRWNRRPTGNAGFRQLDPIGGTATHTAGTTPRTYQFPSFELGAATHASCTAPVEYRWQRTTTPHVASSWTYVAGSAWSTTVMEFTPSGLTETTYFRRLARACGDMIASREARVVVPFLTVSPPTWIFLATTGNSHTFEVVTNIPGTIAVTGLPAWANNVTIDQTNRTFTITTTAVGTTAQRAFHPVTVTVGGVPQQVSISQHGTAGFPAATLGFVGAFWRHNQFGERLIRMTQPTNNAWTAVATVPWIQLCLEPSPHGFPSPLTPGIADTPLLPAVEPHQGTYVTGSGTAINFRIGIRACALVEGHNAPASATAAPRYGQVIVTHNNNATTHIIWVRQGEAADFIMRPPTHPSGGDPMTVAGIGITNENRNAARRISPYNLTAQTLNQSVGTRAQQTDPVWLANAANNRSRFTQYPTQTGAFWQWGQTGVTIRRAWSPIGAPVAGWSNVDMPNFWGAPQNHHILHEVCPPGYRRPADGTLTANMEITNIGAANMRLSELRQSLFLNPQNNTASSVTNSVWGYYADGFFDRRTITNLTGGVPTAATAHTVDWNTTNIAHRGTLFFNPASGASVFLPAAGGRSGIGALGNVGTVGYFWSSTASVWALPTASYLLLQSGNSHVLHAYRRAGFSVRCVAE